MLTGIFFLCFHLHNAPRAPGSMPARFVCPIATRRAFYLSVRRPPHALFARWRFATHIICLAETLRMYCHPAEAYRRAYI
ncbi:hypothetical protein BRYFOR_05112 [Marvinbryantia formatexigens DSM 14469]|uniref:Uncharacterized protein n=1 Tax=Marvinbryantia formatexigens DSM 14469 TaxID=478749 RepID=C6L922_9FIRM|nr:hypothetical protein BRYFOR_05112 [Marvinbryantia formatexigens DSM 14469]